MDPTTCMAHGPMPHKPAPFYQQPSPGTTTSRHSCYLDPHAAAWESQQLEGMLGSVLNQVSTLVGPQVSGTILDSIGYTMSLASNIRRYFHAFSQQQQQQQQTWPAAPMSCATHHAHPPPPPPPRPSPRESQHPLQGQHTHQEQPGQQQPQQQSHQYLPPHLRPGPQQAQRSGQAHAPERHAAPVAGTTLQQGEDDYGSFDKAKLAQHCRSMGVHLHRATHVAAQLIKSGLDLSEMDSSVSVELCAANIVALAMERKSAGVKLFSKRGGVRHVSTQGLRLLARHAITRHHDIQDRAARVPASADNRTAVAAPAAQTNLQTANAGAIAAAPAAPTATMPEAGGGSCERMDIDDDTACLACGQRDSPRQNQIILCDTPGCGKGMHKRCAGLPRLPPRHKKWFCKDCCAQAALLVTGTPADYNGINMTKQPAGIRQQQPSVCRQRGAQHAQRHHPYSARGSPHHPKQPPPPTAMPQPPRRGPTCHTCHHHRPHMGLWLAAHK